MTHFLVNRIQTHFDEMSKIKQQIQNPPSRVKNINQFWVKRVLCFFNSVFRWRISKSKTSMFVCVSNVPKNNSNTHFWPRFETHSKALWKNERKKSTPAVMDLKKLYCRFNSPSPGTRWRQLSEEFQNLESSDTKKLATKKWSLHFLTNINLIFAFE